MLPVDLARYRYSLQNPFPPTDRRYQLAKVCLAQGVTPSVRFDDKYTLGGLQVLACPGRSSGSPSNTLRKS